MNETGFNRSGTENSPMPQGPDYFGVTSHPSMTAVVATVNLDMTTTPQPAAFTVNITGVMVNASIGLLSDPAGGKPPYSTTVTIIIAIVLTCIIVMTVLGNSMVILAFVVDSKLRQKIGNFYLLNLALSDFIIGFISLPLNTLWMLVGRWPLGEVVCKAWVVVDFVACYESVCAIILISLDRFWLVSKKSYLVTQTRRAVFIYCFSSWVFSILLYAPTALGWTAFTGERNIDYTEQCEIEPWENLSYNIVMILLEFIIPLFIIVYLNASIYVNLRRRSRKFQTHAQKNLSNKGKGAAGETNGRLMLVAEEAQEGVKTGKSAAAINDVKPKETNVIADEGDMITKTDSTSSRSAEETPPVDSSWHLKSFSDYFKGFVKRKNFASSSSIRRHKKHRKAAKKLFILVCAFIICWAPYKVMSLVSIVCTECFDMKAWEFVNYLLWCNSSINPILYTFCNRRIRYNFERFMCCFRLRRSTRRRKM
ncbi:histamine H3 receptor-like [Ptychodera flava]|uniref:histamine H3 receptor-like n=1 Tax=Ptychodera flava TaxID=63121 RepID=UPI00396A8A09